MSRLKQQDLLKLYRVPRWGVVSMLRPQSVAEHSFRVAVIAMSIHDAFQRFITNQPLKMRHVRLDFVLRWALCHDGPEVVSGDIPATFKDHPGTRQAIRVAEDSLCPWYMDEDVRTGSGERLIVKIADKIESIRWAEEYGMGADITTVLAHDLLELDKLIADAVEYFELNSVRDIIQSVMLTDYDPSQWGLDQRKAAALAYQRVAWTHPEQQVPQPQASQQEPSLPPTPVQE